MKKIYSLITLALFSMAFTACTDRDDNDIKPINNKCLKRTQGPNIVGNDIYFVYAMAMPYGLRNAPSRRPYPERTAPGWNTIRTTPTPPASMWRCL